MDLQKIISGCKNNERRCQQALFTRFAPYVYTICRRYAFSDEDAKENMQDCFYKILTKIEQFDSNKGSLKSWITRLSINESINKTKPKTKIIPIANVDIIDLQIAATADTDQQKKEKQEMLIKAIQQLPEGYRNVLNLFVFEQKSHKEIAALLDIEAATSRSQLTRAKTLLKQLIQKDKLKSYGT